MKLTQWLSSWPGQRRRRRSDAARSCRGFASEVRRGRTGVEALETRCLLTAAPLASAAYDMVSPVWFATVDQAAAEKTELPSADGSNWILRFTEESLTAATTVADTATMLENDEVTFQVVRGLGLPGQVLVKALETDRAGVEASLAAIETVASFYEDVMLQGQLLPNDPLYSVTAPNARDQVGSNAPQLINAAEAWNLTTGSSDVVVAVIDSGIDLEHPDLAPNLWINPGEIAGNFIDDDGNGFVDDIHGWDFVENDNIPQDENGHGTHVAGTIGAAGNNAAGVAGLAWDTSLMVLRILDASNDGSLSRAATAINYATMMRTRNVDPVNVRVSNHSYGRVSTATGFGSAGVESAFGDAVDAHEAADILIVAAAGNGNGFFNGINLDSVNRPILPAMLDNDNVISVAATGTFDELWKSSNFGQLSVDVAAPGVGIFSTWSRQFSTLTTGFSAKSGTSMAAAHVSGLATLVYSLAPDASVEEVRNVILAGVDPLSSLQGKVATGGRINAFKTLELIASAPSATVVNTGDVTTDGVLEQIIDIQFTDNSAVDVSSLGDGDVIVVAPNGDELAVTFVSSNPNSDAATVTATYRLAAPGGVWDPSENGEYQVRLVANEVRDTEQKPARPVVVGAFDVAIPAARLFVVDSTVDAPDDTIGDGFAQSASGDVTLRAAIMEANAQDVDDSISIPAGTFTFSVAGAGEDLAATGDLDITRNLRIFGAGATQTIIDAGQLDRLFDIASGVTVTLSDMTIRNGSANIGGGIRNQGTLVLERVIVADNSSTGDGGGISSSGTLTATSATFSGNSAAGSGGGVANLGGSASLTNVTLSDNSAGTDGGGLRNSTGSLAFLTNVTIAANSATIVGGGVSNSGDVRPGNSIFAGNTADGANPDVNGAFTSQGNNLVRDVGNATGFAVGIDDQIGAAGSEIDPLLGPLQDNGGATPTHALLVNSPAIDTANDSLAPLTDQRGRSRPRDGDDSGTATSDIGAYEFTPFAQIRGTKFHDLNENGQRDEGEPGLAGWTIFLDENNNSTFDDGELNGVTVSDDPATLEVDETGQYVIQDVTPGSHTLLEVQQSGWVQTVSPGNVSPPTLTTITFDEIDASGGAVSGTEVTNYLSQFGITISGITPSGDIQIIDDRVGFPSTVLRATSDVNVLWHDSPNTPYAYTLNFSLEQDEFKFTRPEIFGATSSGLIVSPWRARAFDSGGNLLSTVGEGRLAFFGARAAVPFTLAGPNIASVVFDRNTTNTSAGFNRVATDNWIVTVGGVSNNVTVGVGDVATDNDFGNRAQPASISGQKFNDLDGDGVKDGGESGLEDWTIFLDQNANGVLDNGETSTQTDAQGNYSFTGLEPLIEYHVAEVQQNGWTQTFPQVPLTLTGSVEMNLPVSQVTAIGTADVNGDGHLDQIVGTGFGDSAKVLLNNGSGQFLTSIDLPNFLGRVISISSADLDLDGDVDLALSDDLSNRLQVLHNDGQGNFTVAVSLPVSGPGAVDVGDLNGDGFADAVITTAVGQLLVFLNNGAGTFSTSANVASGSFNTVEILDLDLDGRQDIVASGTASPANTPGVHAIYGQGSGSFEAAVLIAPAISGAAPNTVRFGDLSENGHPDVVTSRLAVINVVLNNGSRSFGAAASVSVPGNETVIGLGLSDVDADADPDLVATTSGSGQHLVTIRNPGNGDFNSVTGEAFAIVESSFSTTDALRVADFDSDGLDEFISRQFNDIRLIELSRGLQVQNIRLDAGEDAADVDFGNRALPGEIRGKSFQDLDGDGVKEAGEPGREGLTIFLDLNSNGTFDTGEPSTVTNSNGDYSFTGLDPFLSYTVGQVQAELDSAGFTQTSPIAEEGGNQISVSQFSADPLLKFAGDIATDGQTGFYISGGDGVGSGFNSQEIFQIPLNGGSATIFSAANNPNGITTDGQFVYWIDPNGDPDATAIFRRAIGGDTTEKVYSGFATGQPIVDGADIDFIAGSGTQGKLATADFVQGRIHTMNAGSTVSNITQLGTRFGGFFDREHFSSLDEHNGVLYIADAGRAGTDAPMIQSIPVGGGSFTTLFVGDLANFSPQGIVVSDDTIYLTNGATIMSIPTDGSADPTVLVSDPRFKNLRGITILNGDLYVLDNDSEQQQVAVWQVDLNAGNVTSTGKWRVSLGPGEVASDRDFGIFNEDLVVGAGDSGRVIGRVYEDVNGNGAFDSGESGIVGQTVFLDLDGNGLLDVDEPTFETIDDDPNTPFDPANPTTDETGLYVFQPSPGTYTIRQSVPAGFTLTSPVGFTLEANELAAGDFPTGVATGDIDGDGDLDVLAGNAGSDSLSVFLNDGAGTFQRAPDLPAGFGPVEVVLEDLDGDNDLDIATTNVDQRNISVLLNDGTGVFTLAGFFSVGESPFSMVAGDFDGDLDIDLATANEFSDSVSVLLNDGAGDFSSRQDVGTGGIPEGIVAADFDGDNDLDLATSNFGGKNVSILINNGSGSFLNAGSVAAGNGPFKLAAGDFDGDNDTDLAVTDIVDDVTRILFNNGSAGFVSQTSFAVASGPAAITVVDVDGDNNPDLAVTSGRSNVVNVLLGDGGGGFGEPGTFGFSLLPQVIAFGIAGADFDGDGDNDLVVSSGTANTVTVLANEEAFGSHTVTLEKDQISVDRDFGIRRVATTTQNLATGALVISLLGAADVVVSTVSDTVEVRINGLVDPTISILAADVQTLTVQGGSGDNTIDLSGVTSAAFTHAGGVTVTVNGLAGSDRITGGDFADDIDGGTGLDTINGGIGDDTVDGGFGNDLLTGGPGIDLLTVKGSGRLTITPSQTTGSGKDAHSEFESAELSGDISNDRIDATTAAFPVTLLGQSGNDTLLGGSAADSLDGGAGTDFTAILGSNIVVTDLTAPETTDTVTSLEGLLLIASARGSSIDASRYTLGPVTIVGSGGDDTLKGSPAGDSILAGAGRDSIDGGGGADLIAGGRGRDTINGDGGNDSIFGGGGRDEINGDSDSDFLVGGGGRDTIHGGDGTDRVFGGAGRDIIDGDDGADTLFGGGGRDDIAGGLGVDQLNGDVRDDTFSQQVGQDTLIGGQRPAARRAQFRHAEVPILLFEPTTHSSAEDSMMPIEILDTSGISSESDNTTTQIDSAFSGLLLEELLRL